MTTFRLVTVLQHSRIHLVVLLCLSLIGLAGCGKDTAPTKPPDPVPVKVVISPPSAVLTAAGETVQLNAALLDQNGNSLTGFNVSWSSSTIAVATVDGNGRVTAHSDGNTQITAAWSTVRTNITVKVARSPARIVLSPASVDFTARGQEQILEAVVLDVGGVEIVGATLVWESEDPGVATVDGQGVITARMNGQTRVTVTTGTVTASVVVTVQVAESDREVLVALYNATGGPNWKDNTNWLSDEPLDQWHGVRVDSTGRVVSIWLNRNSLTGHLPASLGNLVHLEVLGLAHNELSGDIPAELGNLSLLQRLDLSINQFSGGIPSSLGQLSELSILDFQINQLTGKIPPSLGNLSNLTYLRLALNPMSGPIPPSLGQLDKLQWLYLSGAGLTGAIPAEFGGLASLKEIWMAGNNLNGEIPAALGRLDHLISIDLHDNAGLKGPLPRTFLNLNLVHLRLFGTQVCIPRDLEFQEWRHSFYSIYALDCEP